MFRYICLNLALLLTLILLAGCEDEYSIEMKPCEEGIERKLVLSGQMSDDERQRLAELYEEQIDPNTFRGRFTEQLPNDVGGAGFYRTFGSNMGEAALYSERFRGNDDLNYTIEQLQLASDHFVDFLIGWLEYELGDEPNFANLKEFCDYDLREDVKNMAIYFWLSNVLPEYDSNASEEIEVRAIHYIIERGYFGPKDIEFFIQSYDRDEGHTLTLMRRIIAEQMDYAYLDTAPERLEFLSDNEHAEKSAKQYIRTTQFLQQAWQAKKDEENDPYAEPPDVNIDDYIFRDVDLDYVLGGSNHKVEVEPLCSIKPFSTNGDWDDESGQIAWSASIAGKNNLPTFFYAAWSEPNERFQEEHFDRVILRDKPLAEYCVWREALEEYKAEEWDSFILCLYPGEDLEKQVSSFRFSDYPADANEADEQPVGLSAKARDLILPELKNDKD